MQVDDIWIDEDGSQMKVISVDEENLTTQSVKVI